MNNETTPVVGEGLPPLPSKRGYRDIDGDWCDRGHSDDAMKAYARASVEQYKASQPTPASSYALLAAFDKAIAEELPRVSTLEYNSHEICRHFAEKVRERMSAAHPPAQAPQPQPSEGEWQDIETAPKDGRTILLGYPNRAGKWRTVRGQWMSAEFIADNWDDPDSGEPGWYETAEEADDVPNCWPTRPSHWMALPTAPQSSDEQEQALSELAAEAQTLNMGYDPTTLYVYRWTDGRTQVKAPGIEAPAVVIDMLEEALRAMTEGNPVRQQ